MKLDVILIGSISVLAYALIMSDGDILIGGMLFVALFAVWSTLIPHVRKIFFLEQKMGVSHDC